MAGVKDSEAGGERLMTLPEVAEHLQIAERTAYLWAQTGRLPGFKVGAAWRFKRCDIDLWVDEQKRLTEAKRRGR